MKARTRLFAGRWPAAASLLVWIVAGCNLHQDADPNAAAQAQERERLLAENQALPDVRVEHEEVQRLAKENQELPKARNQYQEAARLRKENEQLRQQLAKLTPASTNSSAADTHLATPPSGPLAQVPKDKRALEEGALNEGDDIMVEPKYLKLILPDYDWERLGRKEPLGIKGLLEKDGVQITNAVQLQEYGITNYVIRRAHPQAAPPVPSVPQP